MKRIIHLLWCLLLPLAWGCIARPGAATLEQKAISRIPKALEKALVEELSLSGGGSVDSLTVLYSCDSLCIIQFKATANSPETGETSFPARYILVQDRVLSHAYGHPVYAEKLTGCPQLSPGEVKETQARFRKEGAELYTFYASTANLIAPEEL